MSKDTPSNSARQGKEAQAMHVIAINDMRALSAAHDAYVMGLQALHDKTAAQLRDLETQLCVIRALQKLADQTKISAPGL